MTGLAVIGLLDAPGRISAGEVLLEGGRIDNLTPEAQRRLRGRRIGMVFQDPLTSLNPLYTVGRQLEETILTHLPLTQGEARRRAANADFHAAISTPVSGSGELEVEAAVAPPGDGGVGGEVGVAEHG